MAPPLEGTWRTGNVTAADMTAALSRAGLQKWIQPFRAQASLGHSNVFLLTLANGVWHQGWSQDGGPFVDNDDGTYRIAGDTVIYHPQGNSPTYRWSVQGGTLRLTLLRDTGTYRDTGTRSTSARSTRPRRSSGRNDLAGARCPARPGARG